MLVLNLPAFENKKYTADDHFHGNGLHGKILTKKEQIRTFGFTLPNNEGLFLESRGWGYLLYYSVTRHENMENMVSVMLCVFSLLGGGGGVNFFRDILGGISQ